MPTFIFYRNGEEVGRHVGSSRGEWSLLPCLPPAHARCRWELPRPLSCGAARPSSPPHFFLSSSLSSLPPATGDLIGHILGEQAKAGIHPPPAPGTAGGPSVSSVVETGDGQPRSRGRFSKLREPSESPSA